MVGVGEQTGRLVGIVKVRVLVRRSDTDIGATRDRYTGTENQNDKK